MDVPKRHCDLETSPVPRLGWQVSRFNGEFVSFFNEYLGGVSVSAIDRTQEVLLSGYPTARSCLPPCSPTTIPSLPCLAGTCEMFPPMQFGVSGGACQIWLRVLVILFYKLSCLSIWLFVRASCLDRFRVNYTMIL